MATAVWDLHLGRSRSAADRSSRHPGHAVDGSATTVAIPSCPAALPQRPGRTAQGTGLPAAVRRNLTFLAAAVLTVGLLSTLPSALDLVGLSGPNEAGGEDAEPAGGVEPAVPPPVQAVVQPGDTIWDLAAPHVPEGMTLQDYVAEVLLLNDVDPSSLEPGSVLDLPQH
jgi:hypothetical protein